MQFNEIIRIKNIFWCAPFDYLYFLSFQLLNEPGLGLGIYPGIALTPFPLDEIQTHDLPIVSQVCQPLDRTFAHDMIRMSVRLTY